MALEEAGRKSPGSPNREILDIVIEQIEEKEGLGVLDVLALKKVAEVTGAIQVAAGAVMANLVLTRVAEAIGANQVAVAVGLVIVRIVAISVELMLKRNLLISQSLQKKHL